jgi:hypothetical protein
MLPPTVSAAKTSRSSGSWARPERTETRSPADSPSSLAYQPKKCASGRCVPAIAFGVPVVPEVKATYARSSGPTETAGAVVGKRAIPSGSSDLGPRTMAPLTLSPSASITSPGTSPAAVTRRMARGFAARTCAARRAGGYAGSRTANAAPAFHVPRSARMSGAERCA